MPFYIKVNMDTYKLPYLVTNRSGTRLNLRPDVAIKIPDPDR
jgi:hypothetical protein